jgi:hypothetical protein
VECCELKLHEPHEKIVHIELIWRGALEKPRQKVVLHSNLLRSAELFWESLQTYWSTLPIVSKLKFLFQALLQQWTYDVHHLLHTSGNWRNEPGYKAKFVLSVEGRSGQQKGYTNRLRGPGN